MSQVDAAPAVLSPRSAAQLLARLADRLRGRVLAPGDAGYDAMRIVMSGEVDARPVLIARPVDADREVRAQWVEELGAALADGDDAAYVNFLADEPDRVRAAYPGPTWDRLAAVKATYDPDNLFRRNQNVPPA